MGPKHALTAIKTFIRQIQHLQQMVQTNQDRAVADNLQAQVVVMVVIREWKIWRHQANGVVTIAQQAAQYLTTILLQVDESTGTIFGATS